MPSRRHRQRCKLIKRSERRADFRLRIGSGFVPIQLNELHSDLEHSAQEDVLATDCDLALARWQQRQEALNGGIDSEDKSVAATPKHLPTKKSRSKSNRRWRMSNQWEIDKHLFAGEDGSRRRRGDKREPTVYDEKFIGTLRRLHALLRKCFDKDEDFYLVLKVKGEVMTAAAIAEEEKVNRSTITRRAGDRFDNLLKRLDANPQLRDELLDAWRDLRSND